MTSESGKRIALRYGVAVLAAVLIAWSIRLFVIEAYRIPSFAMKPLLEPGDTVFVTKYPYGLRLPGGRRLTAGGTPRHGEVVVFSLLDDPTVQYIKRVLALPGDRVEIRRGQLILNGKSRVLPHTKKEAVCGKEALDRSEYEVCWDPPVMADVGPLVVPAGSVLVAGDLRSSIDPEDVKKPWALVPIDRLTGKAFCIWLSIEPPSGAAHASLFSRIRFERMFRRIH